MNRRKLIRCVLLGILSFINCGSFHGLAGEVYWVIVGGEMRLEPACKPNLAITVPLIDVEKAEEEYGSLVFNIVRGFRGLEFLYCLSDCFKPAARFDSNLLEILRRKVNLNPYKEDIPVDLSQILNGITSSMNIEVTTQNDPGLKQMLNDLRSKFEIIGMQQESPLELFVKSEADLFGNFMQKGVLPTFCKQMFVMLSVANVVLDECSFVSEEVGKLSQPLVESKLHHFTGVKRCFGSVKGQEMENIQYYVSYASENASLFNEAFNSNAVIECNALENLLQKIEVLMKFAERIEDDKVRKSVMLPMQAILTERITVLIQYYIPGPGPGYVGIIANPQNDEEGEHNQKAISKFATDINLKFFDRTNGLEECIWRVMILLQSHLGPQIKEICDRHPTDLEGEEKIISELLPNFNRGLAHKLAMVHCLVKAIENSQKSD